MSETARDGGPRRKAYDRAVGMLANRSRSSSEIREGLAARGFQRSTVEEVLGSLLEEGLIDDDAFARDVVIRGQERGKGRENIYAELRRRGIPRAMAEESLQLFFDTEKELGSVRELLSRSLADGRLPEGETEIEKAVSRISRRGYSARAINTVLADLKKGSLGPPA